MKATVVKTFPGAADGEVMPRWWTPGETIFDNLARVAVEQGWAEEIVEAAPQPAAPAVAVKPASKKAKAAS